MNFIKNIQIKHFVHNYSFFGQKIMLLQNMSVKMCIISFFPMSLKQHNTRKVAYLFWKQAKTENPLFRSLDVFCEWHSDPRLGTSGLNQPGPTTKKKSYTLMHQN